MNNNHTTKPLTFNVDCNPINSKALLGIITHMPAPEIVHMCISEILSGIQLNSLDLPFYAAACEVLKNLIVGKLSDNEKEIYNKILKHSNIISVDAAELRKQTKDINKSNCTPKSKEDTVETTDASEDITETDNKED